MGGNELVMEEQFGEVKRWRKASEEEDD